MHARQHNVYFKIVRFKAQSARHIPTSPEKACCGRRTRAGTFEHAFRRYPTVSCFAGTYTGLLVESTHFRPLACCSFAAPSDSLLIGFLGLHQDHLLVALGRQSLHGVVWPPGVDPGRGVDLPH